MIEGITESGFIFEIDEKNLDDWEILEMFEEIDSGKNARLPQLVNRFLGEDQSKELKEHLRDESGRVPASLMIKTFREIEMIIMEENKKVKNS